MKRAPSVLMPESAKKRSPGLTARLSRASPVTAMVSAFGSSLTVLLTALLSVLLASSLKRSRSFIFFQSKWRAANQRQAAPWETQKWRLSKALLRRLGCRKNKPVRRRQVESRLDVQKRPDPGNDIAGGRNGVPAGRDEAVGFLQRLRLVQHDQQLVARLVGRDDGGESGEHALLGVAAVDDLLGGAGLSADVVALDVGLARGADLGVEPHQETHLLRGLGFDHA